LSAVGDKGWGFRFSDSLILFPRPPTHAPHRGISVIAHRHLPDESPGSILPKYTTMSQIFISHSSRDPEQAARLLAWLHANGFSETFLDFDKHAGLAPGADWERTLYREMAGADAVLLILTKNWFDSKWCFAEFTQARALGKAIFPLIEAPTGETIVSPDIQHLDLLKDREGGLARLAAGLTEIVLNSRGGFEWDRKRPPYPGLLAFDEADAAIYFGRDDDIRRLIERLNARRAQGGAKLVAVLGASGAGKSSLLRAGVLPRLKREKRNWIVLPPFRPQLHPLEELAQSIAISLGSAANWRQWRDAFAEADPARALSDLARDLRAAHGSNEAQIVITVDQSEELFGAADKTEAERFLRVLNALQHEHLPFLVLMALRSDYLGQLQEAPTLTAPFEEFSLKPMPLARVRDIIEGPARVAGLTVDDAMIMAAMHDAATDDALPLLAFALRELYDRFGAKKHLTLEAYRALGDDAAHLSPLENAVRRKADEVLAAAKSSPEDLRALRDAFIPAMVRVNAEGEYVRRPSAFDVLPPEARPLIERLAKARLLIIEKERDVTIVEVAHEALLRKWPLLRGWLDEEREFLIGKDQLEQDLRDWESAPPEHKTDALLTGLKLTRARSWLISKPLQLTAAERKFIESSVEHYEADAARRERVRRRVQKITVVAAVALAIGMAASIWAWRSAVGLVAAADSSRLAAQSQQALAFGELDSALRLAVGAAERSPSEPAETALRKVLEGPLEHLILHHGGPVYVAAFSPDGKRIVTASADKTARVWDASTGQLIATLTGHTGPVNDASFSPDSTRIVTASQDNSARVWDASSGNLLATLNGHTAEVRKAMFSPDGTHIVTAASDNTARVWDAQSGALLETLSGHTGAVYTARFSRDGKLVVTASDDHTARVWDAATGRSLATLSGHSGVVYSAAFSPDGARVVTASADNTARVWDAQTGHAAFTLTGHTAAVYDAAFSPDGTKIVTASADNTAREWQADGGNPLATLTGHTAEVREAEFSPDGRRIVTASQDKTSRVWDAETGNLLANLTGHTDVVLAAAFSPDSTRIVTAGQDGTARAWDTDAGHAVEILTGHTGLVCDAQFSPDGTRVVTASQDKTARVWDAATGQSVATLTSDAIWVFTAAFSPDSKSVVTASGDNGGGNARVWDAATGRLLATLTGHTGALNDAEFSPDGKQIVTASHDRTARLWDAGSGRLLATLTGHTGPVLWATFSPDSKLVVTASGDDTARVWDAATGQLVHTLSGHTGGLSRAVFSPNGKMIVTASYDHTARVWDAETGALLQTLTGHASSINDAEFSRDSKRIVTASSDRTARVWDAETGALLATLSGHTRLVTSAAFSPDGTRVATSSADNTARLWDPETGLLLGTLTGHTNRVYVANFSPDGKFLLTSSADFTARIFIADLPDLLAWAKQQLPIDSGQ
jgi:WD40 repeat protein